MTWNGDITYEEIMQGRPFFFGCFSKNGFLASDAYVSFAIVEDVSSFHINDYEGKVCNLAMYDLETFKFVGYHALQDSIIDIKVGKSYHGLVFESLEEEAKLRLVTG